MVVKGMFSPLSGQINFVELLTQLVREILHLPGKSHGISETSGCDNHEV